MKWLKGLFAAIIGGGLGAAATAFSSSPTTSISNPETLITPAIVGAAVTTAAYFKKSPSEAEKK